MPTTLYHATTRDFDGFDEAFIGSNPETHINSNLGIWFGVQSGWLSGFGHRLIEADVDLGTSYTMPVRDLAKLSREHEDDPAAFVAIREKLIERGYDSIAIAEDDGSVHMHVVLKAVSIRAMRDLEPAPAPGLR